MNPHGIPALPACPACVKQATGKLGELFGAMSQAADAHRNGKLSPPPA